MSICVLSHSDQFDLRHGSFKEGWEGFLAKVRDKTITRPDQVHRLPHSFALLRLRGHQRVGAWRSRGPGGFLLEVAHLRARVVGFTPPAHGDCAFCENGAHHERLLRAVDSVRAGQAGAGALRPLARVSSLKVLSAASSSSCSSGGCGACGAAEGT